MGANLHGKKLGISMLVLVFQKAMLRHTTEEGTAMNFWTVVASVVEPLGPSLTRPLRTDKHN